MTSQTCAMIKKRGVKKMNKKTETKRASQKGNKDNQSLEERALKNMPSEPLPQPKDYDEIEY